MSEAKGEDAEYLASLGVTKESLDSSAGQKGEPFVHFEKIQLISRENPDHPIHVEFDGVDDKGI